MASRDMADFQDDKCLLFFDAVYSSIRNKVMMHDLNLELKLCSAE